MGYKWMVILLLGLSVLTFSSLTNGVEVDPISRKKFLEVGKKLNILHKHAVKSIQSEDGDIIDCIHIYKQPAFDHPALRNHTIQMAPSSPPTTKATTTMKQGKGNSSATIITSQLWQKSGTCPEGTIPIRRIKANVANESGRKMTRFSQRFKQLDNNINSYLQQENHSLAILLTDGFSYSGAKGDIKVWNPYVESNDEYSTSQVSLKNGPYMSYEAVESGWAFGSCADYLLDVTNNYTTPYDLWTKVDYLIFLSKLIVNPSVYGDKQTRLFVYWTADSSNKTGCFDLTCPGFVQTSNEVALGAAIYPISTHSGLPYQITLYIFKDPISSNWWVQYGGRINIGYWPPDLFSSLRYNAETVEWGGEVYSPRTGMHPHTATAMGNGQFADYTRGNSGWVKRMRIEENSMELKFPEWVDTYADEYDCYDVFYLADYVDDPEFYYGGPGRNDRCP